MQQSTTQTAQRINAPLPPRWHVANHREVWDRVLPGLIELYESSRLQDWDIEGVHALLEKGSAMLIVDDVDKAAFAVLQLQASLYDDDALELFVLVSRDRWGHGRIWEYIDEAALFSGAKYIRFYSQRRGMARLATAAGYRARSVEYVKEV